MEWLSILAFLACPLMMLFCMKGMFGSKSKSKESLKATSEVDMKNLQINMTKLMEQNQKLMKEVESLKGKSTNVVDLKESKREVC
jgi:hypothetical protein